MLKAITFTADKGLQVKNTVNMCKPGGKCVILIHESIFHCNNIPVCNIISLAFSGQEKMTT